MTQLYVSTALFLLTSPLYTDDHMVFANLDGLFYARLIA
jgi:hypothetical protein